MRSSKSRSRNKSNRQRSIGNIINRVFDSSGPEGKVRGTPQQIIDKYLALARDAQLGNDRVAEQNFLQHAEHYTRMLGEAQREMAREQEERQRSYQQNGRERPERGERDDQPRYEEAPIAEPLVTEDEGPGLVETPEARAPQPVEPEAEAAPEPRPSRRRASEPTPEPGLSEPVETAEQAAPVAELPEDEAARPRPRTRRGPRKPRVPKGEEATAEAPGEAAGE
ncbi:DUF4167 domain-containing protein [Paenirhodobacter sp.]|uniref:DUF4167 domain-containing protein n=1 Tax=Paenirhodobacter sp. TaxID=1965326 RepID=UPI003B4184C5